MVLKFRNEFSIQPQAEEGGGGGGGGGSQPSLKHTVVVEEEAQLATTQIYTILQNYTLTGAVKDVGGILSDFASSKYATSSGLTVPSDNFEINVNFTTGSNFSGDKPIISDDSNIGDIFIQAGTGKISSWSGSGTAVNGVTSMATNTNYSFKLVANGTVSMYLKEGLPSDDINDYTLEYSGFTLYLTGGSLLFGKYGSSQSFNGIIDMNYASVKSNGSIIWQGITKGE